MTRSTFWRWLDEFRDFYATAAQEGRPAKYKTIRGHVLHDLEQLVPKDGRGVAQFISSLGERYSTKFVHIQLDSVVPITVRDVVISAAAEWAMEDLEEFSKEDLKGTLEVREKPYPKPVLRDRD